jgi:hypothetical protein
MVITKPARGQPSRKYILQQVDLGMADLARTGGLPTADENDEIWRDIWYEEAHHSTAIEGNTLVLKQVQVLLDEGRPVGNKVLCEYLDVRGYANAARWVYGQAQAPEAWGRSGAISQAEVREIHRLAVGLVWDVCPPTDLHYIQPRALAASDVMTCGHSPKACDRRLGPKSTPGSATGSRRLLRVRSRASTCSCSSRDSMRHSKPSTPSATATVGPDG